MSTKMKGLLKGLKYISQIFDEEQEADIEIGIPTDVKHVAHIGCDGPADDSPSWMNEYKPTTESQSATPSPAGDQRGDCKSKLVSQDSKRASRRVNATDKDLPELRRPSRRHSTTDVNADESHMKKEPSTKSRQPRRHNAKESSDSGVKSIKQIQETSLATSSPTPNLPDIPMKTRRKKSKEMTTTGGPSRHRSKSTAATGTQHVPSCSDPGPTAGSGLRSPASESSTRNPKPLVQDDKGNANCVISKEH